MKLKLIKSVLRSERLRPDVIVRMPGGQSLIIDSKVSLVAYSDAVNAETAEAYDSAQKRHLASLRGTHKRPRQQGVSKRGRLHRRLCHPICPD